MAKKNNVVVADVAELNVVVATESQPVLEGGGVDAGVIAEGASEAETIETLTKAVDDAEAAIEALEAVVSTPGFRKLTKDEIASGPKRDVVKNSDDDIEAVLELRALGVTYMGIESRLGWKDSHGNRAWRICKMYKLTNGATETVQ